MFYCSMSSTIYNIIYISYQLKFPLFLNHHSNNPMSSIIPLKTGGKKWCFFAHFFSKTLPKATIRCGSFLLFVLRATIRHQNYTLNGTTI